MARVQGHGIETGKGSSPRGEIPRSKVAERAQKAKFGEGESLADGSVVAMTRGNARRAKGPYRRHSSNKERQERDDKTHHWFARSA